MDRVAWPSPSISGAHVYNNYHAPKQCASNCTEGLHFSAFHSYSNLHISLLDVHVEPKIALRPPSSGKSGTTVIREAGMSHIATREIPCCDNKDVQNTVA